MDGEVKVILEDNKKSPRTSVVLSLEIPIRTHNKIKAYRRKINHERKKQYNLKAAYREFLIEKTK